MADAKYTTPDVDRITGDTFGVHVINHEKRDDDTPTVTYEFLVNSRTHEVLENILLQLNLLNTRFEEAFRTNISSGDICDED